MSTISYTNGVSLFTRTVLKSHTCLTRATCAVVQKIQPWQQLRFSSHAPSAPSLLARGQRPVTIQTLQKMYAEKTPITMLTAHNFPSALMAQEAGMDLILVGDSLAMVSLGMADTSEVTLEEMIMSARAVSRAVTRSFTIGDLPMGSYEISPEQALASAIRMVKEGRVQSVKLEGGAEMGPAIKKITTAGIPVCAHIGLTPQRQHALGGFRVQGNTLDKAMSLLKDARAVEEAGAFAVVLECVPPNIAGEVTNALGIPTIGIGAGNQTSGQVLVQIDMLGVRPPDSFMPKFVKKYGSIWDDGVAAIKQYRDEVTDRSYPGPQHVYKGDAQITEAFRAAIRSSKT
ncbi:3-methyl-2-oxobutanoate hydroxymethyltransferase [Exophiala dermatitidis]